jgi:hypothetical protein
MTKPNRRNPKPAPVPTLVVCSICGEDWSAHQEVDGEVSTLECVRLLKAKVAARPAIWRQTYPYWYTPTITYVGNVSQCSLTTGTTLYTNTAVATPSSVAVASAA